MSSISSSNSNSSSGNPIDFDTNGLEKVEYKTTTTNDDTGDTETKILAFFFPEELQDKVPTKSMLVGDSWQLVGNDDCKNQEQEQKACNNNNLASLNLAKLAFQSPIPNVSRLSVTSGMIPSIQLVAKSA